MSAAGWSLVKTGLYECINCAALVVVSAECNKLQFSNNT